MHCSFLETVAFYSVPVEPFLIMSVYIYSIMSKSSIQGLLRQTVELLFSHPITLSSIIPWSQLVRLLLFNPTHIPVLLCAFAFVTFESCPSHPPQPRVHIYRQHLHCSLIIPLDEKIAHVTQSSRPDGQVCANGRAQAIARQGQWS